MVRGVKKIWQRVENTSIDILDPNKHYAMIETYHLLIDNFKTPLEIAHIRKVNLSAVYSSITKLKKKGLVKSGYKSEFLKGGEYSARVSGSNNFSLRMSALSFTIEVLETSPRYANVLNMRNRDELDNNTLLLQPDIITVYLNKDFFGNFKDECRRKALAYVSRFIVLLENNYHIVLKKGRQCNMKEFRCEIEDLNNPLARRKRFEKNKMWIRDLEDGKARVISDFSFKKDSIEFVKRDKSERDYQRYETVVNELLDSDISIVDLDKRINSLVKGLEVTNKALSKLLSSQENTENFKNEILLMFQAMIKEVQNLKR